MPGAKARNGRPGSGGAHNPHGQPAVYGEAMKRITISLTPEMAEWLRTSGRTKRNISARARYAIALAMDMAEYETKPELLSDRELEVLHAREQRHAEAEERHGNKG